MIIPIVADYGIAPEHVFANEFIYDVNNCITEVNQENVMAQEGVIFSDKSWVTSAISF